MTNKCEQSPLEKRVFRIEMILYLILAINAGSNVDKLMPLVSALVP